MVMVSDLPNLSLGLAPLAAAAAALACWAFFFCLFFLFVICATVQRRRCGEGMGRAGGGEAERGRAEDWRADRPAPNLILATDAP